MPSDARPPEGALPAATPPGAGVALASYFFLLLGFVAIGFASQSRDAVGGLWLTEALAIALPALIALRAANVQPGPYCGLRATTWLALAAAVGLAFLNQGPVTLLEYAAQQWAPASWVKA